MWRHQVPEFESSASSQDDNPFAGLIWRNSTSLSLKATLPVTFVVPKTEKWYDMCAEKMNFYWSNIPCWTDAPARLNSFFPRIARQSLPLEPASRPIPQDTLRRWESSARHQLDWSKVSLYPSHSFLYKNQLAKEGPNSVPPVVVPALAPTLDKSLKADRSLCPVRALHYYLDRTSDLMLKKELFCLSFKKRFNRDTSPAIIKQTAILCYEFSDQAFQSGVSFE